MRMQADGILARDRSFGEAQVIPRRISRETSQLPGEFAIEASTLTSNALMTSIGSPAPRILFRLVPRQPMMRRSLVRSPLSRRYQVHVLLGRQLAMNRRVAVLHTASWICSIAPQTGTNQWRRASVRSSEIHRVGRNKVAIAGDSSRRLSRPNLYCHSRGDRLRSRFGHPR